MDVRNCARCGKIFNYITGQPICVDCKKALESQFVEVKQFLRENPNSSIQEVLEATKVELRQLKQWIREERITFSAESMVGIECERCGATIKTGRFCSKCKGEVADSFESTMSGYSSFKAATPDFSGHRHNDREDERLRFRR